MNERKGELKVLMVNLTNICSGEGGAFHQLALMREFSRSGIDPYMIVPHRLGGGDLPDILTNRCILSPSVDIFGFPLSFDCFLQIPSLIWLRLFKQYKILYVRYSLFSFILVVIARCLKMKVISEHNSWGKSERMIRDGGKILSGLEVFSQVWTARLSHRSRCVTQGIADILEGKSISSKKLVVIGNGTDTQTFFPINKEEACKVLGFDPHRKRVGFIGGLMRWQGCGTAIRALANLTSIDDVQLVIAGDGPERQYLETLAQDVGISKRVLFLGYVQPKDANLVINSFDIALAPFTRERNEEIGLSPIKIRDYAAAGCPVVASAIPGISELANKGWLFTHHPDDFKGLAALIEKMFSPKFDLQGAGKSGRIFAESNFEWKVLGCQVASLLKETGSPN
jgi:glycosyltransferase involved in cell wall biosynthesis